MKTWIILCVVMGLFLGDTMASLQAQSRISGNARGYCFIAAPQSSGLPVGPARFSTGQPSSLTSLAPSSSPKVIIGGCWSEGKWYGSEEFSNGTGGGWWTIDTASGAMTKIADPGKCFIGLAYDRTTQIMYGVENNLATQVNTLYSIIPSTGAAVRLGDLAQGEYLINLATDGSGFLYSIGAVSDHLFKINPAGLAVTDIGPTGINFAYAQGMAYDYASGTMYETGFAYVPGIQSNLYTVNLSTGAFTDAGRFAGDPEITAFAIPYTGMAAVTPRETESRIHVYPNPATDAVTIEVSEPVGCSLQTDVYNLMGTCVITGKPSGAGVQSLRLDGLPAGIYFCHAHSAFRSEIIRLVKSSND